MEMKTIYDEDLEENKFLVTLQRQQQSLYDYATTKRLLICVPRSGALGGYLPDRSDYESHLLVSVPEISAKYLTVNGKEIFIDSNVIETSNGFPEHRTVPILFEETFFNKNEESYRVLCINQPLQGGQALDEGEQKQYHVQTLEDCADLLWGHASNLKTQKQLDDLVDSYTKILASMAGDSLRHHIDVANSQFTKAMQIVLRDNMLKRTARHNVSLMDGLKLSVETYLLHGVYSCLFRSICTCVSEKDAYLNKVTRNLARIRLRDLGVRLEFCENVPRARRELSNLERYSTPLCKLNCLRRVVRALSHPTSNVNREIALTTDDLLPILVFLVVKAEMPNWYGNFVFMTSFRFSRSTGDDEDGFYLASLEAAIEHVCSGQIQGGLSREESFKNLPISYSPLKGSLWQRQDSDTSTVDMLFQAIQNGDLEETTKLLDKEPTPEMTPELQKALCHPLCDCPRCSSLLSARKQTAENSQVTVYSRDDRGYTVLHICSLSGDEKMMDFLVQRGALINSADYHGATPLHISCQKGHQNIVLLLLNWHVRVNVQDNEGNTPIHLATGNGHEDCVKALIFSDQSQHRLNLNEINDFGDTALHLATKWGFCGIVDLLLTNGAIPDTRNRKNLTPRQVASNVQVTYLLDKAINDRVEQAHMRTQDPQPRRHSLQGQQVNRTMTRSQSVQHLPASHGRRPPMQKSATMSLYSPPKTEKSANPVVTPSPENLKLATALDRKVEKLLKAVADGDEQMVFYHLNWNSDSSSEDDAADAEDTVPNPLCHPLCQCERCAPKQKYLSFPTDGIHVNSLNSDGFTALHVAAMHGHLSLVELFVRRGAKLEAKNYTQDATPLYLACRHNKAKVVESLLRHKAAVDVQDSQGSSPLHACCCCGNCQIAEMLLKREAPVNLINVRGNTPLHDASRWNFVSMVRLLLRYGADVNLLNQQNLTPLQVAENPGVTSVLQQHMRDSGYLRSAQDELMSSVNIVKIASTPFGITSRSGESRRSLDAPVDVDVPDSGGTTQEGCTPSPPCLTDQLHGWQVVGNSSFFRRGRAPSTASQQEVTPDSSGASASTVENISSGVLMDAQSAVLQTGAVGTHSADSQNEKVEHNDCDIPEACMPCETEHIVTSGDTAGPQSAHHPPVQDGDPSLSQLCANFVECSQRPSHVGTTSATLAQHETDAGHVGSPHHHILSDDVSFAQLKEIDMLQVDEERETPAIKHDPVSPLFETPLKSASDDSTPDIMLDDELALAEGESVNPLIYSESPVIPYQRERDRGSLSSEDSLTESQRDYLAEVAPHQTV